MSKKNKKAPAAAAAASKKIKIEKPAAAKNGKQLSPSAAALTMHEKFADLFVISMLSIFPIYMTDKLFHIRTDRRLYFVVTTFVMLFFIAATYICGIDKDRKPTGLFKMTVPDIAFISFTVIALISACLSEYGEEAFTGSEGRDSGFYLIAVYLLCYLLLSRYFRYKEVVFTVFAVMASAICFLGVLHEFSVDPFSLISEIKQEQQKDFISTIGNINMFSGFVCVAFPACCALAATAKDTLSTIFYSVTVGFCTMGLLVANSMSGYFGVTAFLALLFVYCCGNAKRFFHFWIIISTIFLSMKVLRLISLIFHDEFKNLEDVSRFLVFDKLIFIPIAVSAAITVGMYFVYKKFGEEHSPKWIQFTAAGIVTLAALSILGVFIYFSFIDKETDLGSLKKILRLNDQWGTHRGYAWIRGVELFHSNGIKNILVGSGPDTFGQVIKAVYREDMLKRHGSVFDTAHNEFINYLVTTGALGLISYTTLVVSVIVRAFRRSHYDAAFIVVVLPVIGYIAQSIFSLSTPIITPFLIVFLAVTEAHSRKFDAECAEAVKE